MKRERKLINVFHRRITCLCFLTLLSVGVALNPVPAEAQPILVGWEFPRGLVSIDTTTGASTLIISSNRQIEGLAFDPIAKVLYGVENLPDDNVLVIIDLDTGTISDVGFLGGFTEITAMTFDETTGTIFAVEQTARRLLHINPSTGAATDIGSVALFGVNALAAQPGTGQLFAGTFLDPCFLAMVDKTTGSTTLVGSTGSNVVAGLDFHPVSGQLFGWAQFRDPPGFELVTLDLTTGLATRIGGSGQIVALEFVDLTATVDIDIKPGAFPNNINPRNKGVIPVAILTTNSFNAATVDETTVLFGATGTEAAPVLSALKDVDGDGNKDMILRFKIQATEIECGDTSASLTGETFSGQMIQGADSVKTAGCK